MKIRPEILDHWPEVSARLPAGFDVEATARSRGAFTRAREIKNPETLLRLALGYGGLRVSLRENCAGAGAGGNHRLDQPSVLQWPCQNAPSAGGPVGSPRCVCCRPVASLLISLHRLPLRPSRKARCKFASTKASRGLGHQNR